MCNEMHCDIKVIGNDQRGKKKEKLQTFGSCMGYHANAMLNAKKASVPDISQS